MSPQLEDGYTRIANELLENGFAKHRITGEAMQVLWVIIRKTYGWGKTEDYISYSQFVEATGLKSPNIGRAIKWLIKRNIIKCSGGHINQICLNKNYETWICIKKDTKKTEKVAIKIDTKPVSKLIEATIEKDTKPLSISMDTKEIKETIQKKVLKKEKTLTQNPSEGLDEYTKGIVKQAKLTAEQNFRASLPTCLTSDATYQLFLDYLKVRKSKKLSNDKVTVKYLADTLQALDNKGWDINESLKHSIKGEYKDIFERVKKVVTVEATAEEVQKKNQDDAERIKRLGEELRLKREADDRRIAEESKKIREEREALAKRKRWFDYDMAIFQCAF